MKPRLLDLFCGAGGAAMGYHRAGFEVVGVDIKPQPHYPFPFLCMDAREAMDRLLKGEGLMFSNGETLYMNDFVAIHASPPCQGYSVCTKVDQRQNYARLIHPVREKLQGKYYIIENVAGARYELNNPIWLCGTMFGLPIHRHRYFELSFEMNTLFTPCGTENEVYYITGSKSKSGKYVREPNSAERKKYLDTPWMNINEMDEAIPPAYTEFIGKFLIQSVKTV